MLVITEVVYLIGSRLGPDAEVRFLGALDTATEFSFVLGKLVITYQRDDSYRVLVFERDG